MKLTIRKTLLFSLLLFFVLAVAALAVTFFRVNRTVMVAGEFTYRDMFPITVEEAGFVRELLIETDERVADGDVIAVLSNPELDREISGLEKRLAMSAIELDSLARQANSIRFDTEQDILALESVLETKTLELDFRSDQYALSNQMHQAGSITKEQHDASRLTFMGAEAAVKEIEIQLSKRRRALSELDSDSGSPVVLKQKTMDIDRDTLEYLRERKGNLQIRAPGSGVLLSTMWDSIENTYLAKGARIGDVVSFDDINFVGYARDTDIIRIKEGQKSYFDVDIFRRKVFVQGTVTRIGYQAVSGSGGVSQFPVTIEVDNKLFIDRDQEFYIQAGVKGQAVIIVEEELSLFKLVWEKIVDFVDFGVYVE